MKQKLMRKAAEVKAALVSKEAANNSTEIVIILLFVVVIAAAVGIAVKNLLVGSDGEGGQIATLGDNIANEIANA